MQLPSGYTLDSIIHRGASRLVVRAIEVASGQRVVIKTSSDPRASTESLAALHHEFGILERLDVPGVARARGLYYVDGCPHLVMDDLGGVRLRSLTDVEPLPAPAVLAIGHGLARIVEELHRARIIHKNINPDHVIVDGETHEVQLIDFSIASVLPKETQKLASPRGLEGALPYISPEQTGRMNRSIDPRTDFYSLGVTLYELIAGRLPFEASSPLEWVHCHIAKTPADLRAAQPSCSPALAAVVMKLFAKNAEDRYQSARGLLADLDACEAIGDDEAASEAFVPGCHDHTDQFQLPQRLYGRETQLQALLAAYGEVSQGQTAMMLVSGYSGIGKTSLIAELHKPIVRHRGYFISGKFDQFKRDIPYASLIQAFSELVRQLMTESEEALTRWRSRLIEALGANAQVIVEVLPEVEKIIGRPQRVQVLEAAEAQNRFNRVFQDFVRVFAAPEHPLAIFLDDLQWADSASLKLLQLLCTDPNSTHVFLIGAYRDNEVDAAHPLTLVIKRLEDAGARVDSLHLGPLGIGHVEHFVADTLCVEVSEVTPLARLIHERTLGNPFFVSQCLRELHDSSLLRFNPTTGAWDWELARIEEVGITDNVVELMAGKILRLAAPTQNALTLAACIGNSFDVETLAVVAGITIAEAAALLWPALQERLVVPISDACRVLQRGEGEVLAIEAGATISCRFLHDRVQQAAYSLIAEREKKRVHLRVGRRMLAKLDGLGEGWQFEVVNHMNIGAELIVDPAQRLRLGELNLHAGTRARDSTAYGSAITYLEAGIALLPTEPWIEAYAQTFALHKLLSECSYLHGEFDRAEQLFELILARARDRHEKAQIYNIRIAFYSSVGRFTEAIDAGFEGLELYGIELRSAGADLSGAIERALVDVEAKLGGREWSTLVELPMMTDPAVEDCMHLLMNLTTQTYIGDQDWFPLIAMKMVSLSLEHGNSLVSAFGYGYLGVILGTLRGEYEAGHTLGQLSLELNERLDQPALNCKLHWIHGALINHWVRPIRTDGPLLRSSVHYGIETGDYVFGSWAYYYLVVSVLLSGERLSRTLDEADAALAFFRKIKNKTYADLQEIVRNVVLNLRGASSEPSSLSTETFDEGACIADMRARSHGPGLGRYHVLKMMVLCIHELYDEACEVGAESENTLRYLTAQPLLAEHFFYYGISLCQRLEGSQDPGDRAKAGQCLERLRGWAASCRENFLHKALLLEAELARVDGRVAEAMERYEEAIDSARAHGFVHNEAMAHLLAGRLHASRRLSTSARAHLRSARDLYARWGASSCVDEIEARYPVVGEGEQPRARSSALGLDLDALTLAKTTRAISGELRLGSLLDTVVEIMVESAGAQRGYLLRERGRELVVVAANYAGESTLEGQPRYAERVLNYVRHAGERVVLGHAQTDATFADDPHIVAHGVKSLLCMPMRRGGAVVAYLYLENSLMEDTFTAGRVEMLELQTAQATISLDNAKLYAELEQLATELEQRVGRRTAELREANAALELELEQREQRELERDSLQREIIALQEARVLELSTPLIPITARILVMPLIGSMDQDRAERVMEVVLTGAQSRRARVVIIDLTGLRVMDTATANTLMRCARSLGLLGVDAVLTGIKPQAAITLIELGIELNVITRDTLQSGIATALRVTGEYAVLRGRT